MPCRRSEFDIVLTRGRPHTASIKTGSHLDPFCPDEVARGPITRRPGHSRAFGCFHLPKHIGLTGRHYGWNGRVLRGIDVFSPSLPGELHNGL
jgi:hypothetical protein